MMLRCEVNLAKRVIWTVDLESTPRMADFAEWVVAAEPALPWKSGEFMKAYTGNRDSAHDLAIEANLIGPAVTDLIDSAGEWTGRATDLLGVLNERRGNEKPPSGWPKRANVLSNHLRRIAPNLRAVGYTVEFSTRTKQGIIITLGTGSRNTVTIDTIDTDCDSEPNTGTHDDDW